MNRIQKLDNIDEVIEQFADILRDLEVEYRPYQTDVYLYIDDDNAGRVEEFVNPGGIAWLNDDHILLHSNAGGGEPSDAYANADDLCAAIGKTKREIADEMEEDPNDLEDWRYASYINSNYRDKLIADIRTWADDVIDFKERAREIISDYEEEV